MHCRPSLVVLPRPSTLPTGTAPPLTPLGAARPLPGFARRGAGGWESGGQLGPWAACLCRTGGAGNECPVRGQSPWRLMLVLALCSVPPFPLLPPALDLLGLSSPRKAAAGSRFPRQPPETLRLMSRPLLIPRQGKGGACLEGEQRRHLPPCLALASCTAEGGGLLAAATGGGGARPGSSSCL